MSRKNQPKKPPVNFEPNKFTPLNATQREVFKSYEDGQNLVLHGYSGTGKSFVALYLALDDIWNYSDYKKIVIVRSAVPSRDLGHLPGGPQEKVDIFELPYHKICAKIFGGRGDAFKNLKAQNRVDFESTSYLRGTEFTDSIIIVDEFQNMDSDELNTVMTRIGKNCKIIVCGDFRQTDFKRTSEKSGIHQFLKTVRRMEEFDFHEFGIDDIVRSDFVKSWIIESEKVKDENIKSKELSACTCRA